MPAVAEQSVISRYPKWLHRILSGNGAGRFRESNYDPPSELEEQAAMMALDGEAMRDICKATKFQWNEVESAIKKVRDEMRRGEASEEFQERHGELCDYEAANFRVEAKVKNQKRPGGKVDVQDHSRKRVRFPVSIDKLVRKISDGDLELPRNFSDEEVARFSERVLARARVPMAVIGLRQMCEAAMEGDTSMIARALDFVYGGRSAKQGKAVPKGEAKPEPQVDANSYDMEFEKIIAKHEEADGSGFGKGGEDDIIEVEDFPENDAEDGEEE